MGRLDVLICTSGPCFRYKHLYLKVVQAGMGDHLRGLRGMGEVMVAVKSFP